MKLTIEQIIIQFTLCITGHRPNKLPWGYNENDERCIRFKNDLKIMLEKAIQNGWHNFITGMALGVDTIFAEIVLSLKNKYKNINLIAVLPCKNQDSRWNIMQRKRYRELLKKCDIVETISEVYTDTCMNKRNKFMIEHSSACIAVWNSSPSGTGNAVKYAKEVGCKVKIINPDNYK